MLEKFHLASGVVAGTGFVFVTGVCFSTWLAVAHSAGFMSLTLRLQEKFVERNQMRNGAANQPSPVRGDNFVELQPEKFSSSVRSDIFRVSIRLCRSWRSF